MTVGMTLSMPTAAELHHQPWSHRDGDEEGEDHGGGGIGRDRAHVRAHHAGHEEHGKKCRDHCQRRHDGGVADFGHRFDGRLNARAPIPHGPVPGNVLDHHDGIINEDADGKDQREETHTIERVAHDARSKEGQQYGGRNDHGHDDCFPPADRERHQKNDRHCGEAEVEEKLIRLLIGGLAIIAGNLDIQVGRNEFSLQLMQTFRDALGNDHRIGAGALGQSQ